MAFDKKPELFDEEGDSMAFGLGLGHGFKQIDPRANKNKSTKNNPYYYYPGFVLGYMLKAIAIFLMGGQFGLW